MFDTSHINDAIALRRDLHRHPELGFEEHRTSEKIATLLGEWGWRVHRGLAGTGVVAQMGQGAPVIGLRADIDALPMDEATGLDYASGTPGKGHQLKCSSAVLPYQIIHAYEVEGPTPDVGAVVLE